MLRIQEAEANAGKRPARAALHPEDYRRLALDMRRYGFFPSKYYPKPLQVLNVLIEQAGADAPQERTVRFEWSE
jgi:hypothetical protein